MKDENAINKILKDRTRESARKIETDSYSGQMISVFEFILSSERYAIESSFIMEIVPLSTYTSVPKTPGFITGIFTLRGQLFTLIDLAVFFQLEPPGRNVQGKVLLVNACGMTLGVLVDEYTGIRSIREEEICDEIPVHTEKLTTFIKWITKDQMILLNPEKIIESGALIVDVSLESN